MDAGTAAAGVDASRVAELIVGAGSGLRRRGSGYRVTAEAVLTAAHVVEDAASVQVRFNADLADEWTAAATVEVADPAADVAVLGIVPPAPMARIPPVLFGRVGRRAAIVGCTAVGFPRFKLRTDTIGGRAEDRPGSYRDSHQAYGTVSSLSNWREGTLEMLVSPPEEDPDPAHSPWEGMSGAAVWSGGRIVGVVSKHHRSDGLNRLAAVRADRWYSKLPAGKLARLCTLTGLPPHLRQLVDVIPPGAAEAVAANYTEQVEAIAPSELLDREAELAELVGFCAGDEPYQWWRADPWAGKTALAASLVLHPPLGVTAVSFFVTGRLSGQADSSAFTEALIEQLAVVAGEPGTLAATPAARDGQRRRLIKQAAARAQERGERLLIVVDGIDEDQGIPPAGPSSIVSLLPERPPPGVRILVTSRPHPGVPVDVPGRHPLRTCAVRQLAPSAHAAHLEIAAKRELVEYLQGTDPLKVNIVGYIAAAGGGLTLRELVELTEARQPEAERRLGGAFGRSLATRTAAEGPPEPAEQVYLFAHETLREHAEQQLAYDLRRYRQRIDQWADTYRDQGWPDSAPRYLLRPYARQLAATGELARLGALATDRVRHDWMLDRTLGDAVALAEIADAQQLCLAQQRPDLTTLVVLAIERNRLTHRNRALPASLPSLWVRLGQPHRADALARSIPDPARMAEALAAMAGALAAADQPDLAGRSAHDAERAARDISDPGRRAEVLAKVAEAFAATRQPDQADRSAHDAERAARSISDPQRQSQALAKAADAFAAAGELAQAERTARSISSPGWRISALGAVTSRFAPAGDPARAEQAAHRISDPERRASALAEVSAAFAASGELHQAERAARSIGDPAWRAPALAWVAETFAATGNSHQAVRAAKDAELAARSRGDPAHRASALASVAKTFAATGNLHEAERAANEAELAARSVVDPVRQWPALAAVAASHASTGHRDRAEQVAQDADLAIQHIADPSKQVWALAQLASWLAAAGMPDRAEQAALASERAAYGISEPYHKVDTLVVAIGALAATGQLDQAKRAAEQAMRDAIGVVDDDPQYQGLTELAEVLAEAGLPGQAEQAAQEAVRAASLAYGSDEALAWVANSLAAAGRLGQAEQAAGSIADPERQVLALASMTEALAAAGRLDQAEQAAQDAERAARSDTSPERRADVLAAAAQALASAGRLDQAEQAARDAERAARSDTSPERRAELLAQVAKALATAGQQEQAERIVPGIADPRRLAEAQAAQAGALATAGQLDEAERVAADITDPWYQARALSVVAGALATAGQLDEAERVAVGVAGRWRLRDAFAAIIAALTEADRLDEAERIASSINDGMCMDDVAEAYAAASRLDQAERVAASIADPLWRDRALAKVTAALVAIGELREAERVAGRITDPADQAAALAKVASAFAAAGQQDQTERVAQAAERVARSGADRVKEARALTAVAAELAEAGQLDEAERAAADVLDPSRLAETMSGLDITAMDDGLLLSALHQLTKAYAVAGQLDRVEQTARAVIRAASAIHNPQRRTQALSLLAIGFAGDSQLDHAKLAAEEAIRAARDISDPEWQASSLTILASTPTFSRELGGVAQAVAQQAERAARDIVDPERQAGALLDLAEQCLRADPDCFQALVRDICGLVLTGSFWQSAVPLMCRLDPKGFVRIVDALRY